MINTHNNVIFNNAVLRLGKAIDQFLRDIQHEKVQDEYFQEDIMKSIFDTIGIGDNFDLDNFSSKVNFNERLRKCFSIGPSFWEALNKEFKSYYDIQLTNEGGLVTIRSKNYKNEYVKFSYIDNGDETISIDIGKVEYSSLAAMVIFGNIYDAAMNSGFKFVKITDNSNDKEFKKFSPEIIKYLKDNKMNMFSWK